MSVITISGLNTLINPPKLSLPIDDEAENLQLAMKQTCMKLPTEPLLIAHTKIDRWIMEIGFLYPEVFEWEPPQFLVDVQINAQLNNTKDTWVQINTNAAFLNNGYVNLIEWSIRQPTLNWTDKVKLWVTTEYLSLSPDKLELTILALHPTYPAKRHEISWDSQQHEETIKWLMSVLTAPASPVPIPVASTAKLNLEKIAEVEI
ncbi:hypothetical protein NIES2119_29525 [[Phormidium ambiguum] IAM M-71]|uniref:Uncharacterized protein n=1 Tax=[Phormidium ambiguum] IAM M-71 TaxID=454136 RepID=A0A1U7I4J1_9CYAN|nr:hypothetical protein [Phormidium ambiguum]OKH31111.1 hypothetical protein NIES2119_29525 [Phormidium ambiguum IAM M-71]